MRRSKRYLSFYVCTCYVDVMEKQKRCRLQQESASVADGGNPQDCDAAGLLEGASEAEGTGQG